MEESRLFYFMRPKGVELDPLLDVEVDPLYEVEKSTLSPTNHQTGINNSPTLATTSATRQLFRQSGKRSKISSSLLTASALSTAIWSWNGATLLLDYPAYSSLLSYLEQLLCG